MTEMTYRTLVLTLEGSLGVVSLAQSLRGNRIDASMAAEIRECCSALEHDDSIRVVAFEGQGSDFCVGSQLDAQQFRKHEPGTANQLLQKHRVADAVASITKPVIAILQGKVWGQGLELALSADFRLAEEGTSLSLPQITWGMIPWDGGTQRLPRLIGSARALELLLSGIEVAPVEALKIGLLNGVVEKNEGLKRARILANDIASRAPIATRYAKEAVRQGQDMPLDQGLTLEADLNFLLHTTKDRKEGLSSFLNRTTPKYLGQ